MLKFSFFLIAIILIKKIKNENCTIKNCPISSGECIESICLCAPGYTTYYSYEPKNVTQSCNYAYKY